MSTKKIALFIDADNISSKFGKQIIETLESRGEIFIRRIYGNWEKSPLHGWNECILNYSLRAVQQPDFVTGKNATDMSLTIDAMDVLHEGKAEIFALVSNDSDFTPLVIRLREGGMTIIGLGNANASNAFRAACNEFIDLNAQTEIKSVETPKVEKKISPVEKKSSAPVQLSLFDEEINRNSVSQTPKPSSSKVVPITAQNNFDDQSKLKILHDVLHETAITHGDDKGFVALCWAGQNLHNKNLGFSIKDCGYGSLRRFISNFPNLYELILRDNGENFCYRCLSNKPKKEIKKISDDRIQTIHDILREAASVHGDAQGFSLLNYAGQQIKNKNLGFGIKDFGYNQLREFVSDFPDLYETTHDLTGQQFRYRCKHVQKL